MVSDWTALLSHLVTAQVIQMLTHGCCGCFADVTQVHNQMHWTK